MRGMTMVITLIAMVLTRDIVMVTTGIAMVELGILMTTARTITAMLGWPERIQLN